MDGSDARDLVDRVLIAGASRSSDFDLNEQSKRPSGRDLRPAAVLVGIQDTGGGPHVILTKRSSRLQHHPGQIAFPGGKVDALDGSPEAAALREAEEEIGLPRGDVEILGVLPPHETVTAFSVVPVLGWVRSRFEPVPEPGEVSEVFSVPLGHLTNPANFRVESRQWAGRQRFYYVVPWGPYYIWGATARILRSIAESAAR